MPGSRLLEDRQGSEAEGPPQERDLVNRGRGLKFGKWEGSQGSAQKLLCLGQECKVLFPRADSWRKI